MSKDTRLGADPLSWVSQTSDTGSSSDNAASAIGQADGPTLKTQDITEAGGIFSPAANDAKEDAMSKKKVKIEQTMDKAEVVGHLKDLTASLESGTLRAESGDNTVVLTVADTIEFEMKISRKKNRGKCSLELEWKEADHQENVKLSDA